MSCNIVFEGETKGVSHYDFSKNINIEFDDIDPNDEVGKIITIDIGMNNLALYKERVNLTKIKQIKNIPKSRRYTANGVATPEFQKILNQIYLCGKREWLDKVNITSDTHDKFIVTKTKKGVTRKRRVVNNQMLLRLTDYLQNLKDKGIFDDVDDIIIELQLKTNPPAQEIQFHIKSTLLMWYRDTKNIILFPSKYKTQIIGAEKKLLDNKGKLGRMTKPQRKKWAKEIAFEILTKRNDLYGINLIFVKNKKKADDISDCILMVESYCYLFYVDNYKYL